MKRIVLCMVAVVIFSQDRCMEQGGMPYADYEMRRAQIRVRRWVDEQIALHRIRVLQEQLKLPNTSEPQVEK